MPNGMNDVFMPNGTKDMFLPNGSAACIGLMAQAMCGMPNGMNEVNMNLPNGIKEGDCLMAANSMCAYA